MLSVARRPWTATRSDATEHGSSTGGKKVLIRFRPITGSELLRGGTDSYYMTISGYAELLEGVPPIYVEEKTVTHCGFRTVLSIAKGRGWRWSHAVIEWCPFLHFYYMYWTLSFRDQKEGLEGRKMFVTVSIVSAGARNWTLGPRRPSGVKIPGP